MPSYVNIINPNWLVSLKNLAENLDIRLDRNLQPIFITTMMLFLSITEF
jgi:hypothetical protein